MESDRSVDFMKNMYDENMNLAKPRISLFYHMLTTQITSVNPRGVGLFIPPERRQSIVQ